MALFRLRKTEKPKARKGDAAPPRHAASAEESLPELRQRARHRLIGAVVLVLVAIVVFPLLFDTEQRPEVVDAPVVIADAADRTPAASKPQAPASSATDAPAATDSDGGRADPGAEPDADAPAIPVVDASPIDDGDADDLGAPVDDAADDEETESDDEFSTAPAKVRVGPRSAAEPSQTASTRDASSTPRSDTATAAEQDKPKATAASKDDEARRAQAALQGRGASSSGSQQGQFVVQVGAFAQEQQVQSVRQRISGAGLKSFTQVVETDAGPRTRVRVGPYGSRDEADRARAALERAGLPGQVMGH